MKFSKTYIYIIIILIIIWVSFTFTREGIYFSPTTAKSKTVSTTTKSSCKVNYSLVTSKSSCCNEKHATLIKYGRNKGMYMC
jgi:hypothetical protein